MRRFLIMCSSALVALSSFATLTAAPASAATTDPCKVLKTAEISKVFEGAQVGKGDRGLKTAVNESCTFDVAAAGDRPAGTLTVNVMFKRGKAAYDGLKKEAGYVPTTGLAKSLYDEKTSAVLTLKGDVLLTMQGLFSGDELPIVNHDVLAQLVAASKTGLKRV